MADQAITNPNGAHKVVTDFRTGRDSAGEELSYGKLQNFYRADAVIGKGEVLMWVAPTATVPLSVTPMTAAAADNLFAGIAQKAATAAGQMIGVVEMGYCIVDVAAETAAFGSVVTAPATTTGKAEIGATFDATLVVASYIGTALGAKDASNLVPCIIRHA